MSVYKNDWSCWEDVQRDFGTQEPLPDQVIYADYSYEDYSGSAIVIYRNGEDYFLVEGGHCSCYGLSGDDGKGWEPEKYTKDLLIAAFEKCNAYGVSMGAKEAVLALKQ